MEDAFLKKLNVEKFSRGVSAPDFTLKDLSGNAVSLQGFKGKIVFLNFWATWCPPCRLEMPTMEELHKEFSDRGLVILAINFREGPEKIKAFYTERNLTMPALLDPEEKVFGLYKAWSLPTTYLINRDGEIVGKVIGYRDWHSDHAKAFFRQLLENQV